MFLAHCGPSGAGVLVPNKASSILKDVPLASRSAFVETSISLFEDKLPVVNKAVPTMHHLNWHLEVLGSACSLPIEEEPGLVDRVLKLYSHWFTSTGSKDRPAVVAANEQEVFQRLLLHLTFIFEVRELEAKPLERQLNLCISVLDLLTAVGRDRRLLPITWEVMLRSLLGTTDYLLRINVETQGFTQSPGEYLSQELCGLLIKVLFELWLRSKTSDLRMWQNLARLSKNWIKRAQLVNYWNGVCLGLTQRMLRILYGPTEGTDIVSVPSPYGSATTGGSGGMMIEVNLSDEYVMFMWHRMVHLLGDISKISHPIIHRLALHGAAQVVDTFLKVARSLAAVKKGTQHPKTPNPPHANSILDLPHGRWLFDAAQDVSPAFKNGRAIAVGCLCRIFTARTAQPFSTKYLARFYRLVIASVRRGEVEVVSELLTNGKFLLGAELSGITCLVPPILACSYRALVGPDGSKRGNSSTVRMAAIIALSTIFPMPCHLEGVDVPYLNDKTGEVAEADTSESRSGYVVPPAKESRLVVLPVKKFEEMHQLLHDSLLQTLGIEKDRKNLQAVVWACGVFIYESIDAKPHMSFTVIKALLRGLRDLGVWDAEVIEAVIRVLASLTRLFKKIHKANATCVPSIVQELCYFIRSILLQPQQQQQQQPPPQQQQATAPEEGASSYSDGERDSLASEAFYCILDWVMAGSELFATKNALMSVIRTIRLVLADQYTLWIADNPETLHVVSKDVKKKTLVKKKKPKAVDEVKEAEPKAKEAAVCVYYTILHHFLSFPASQGPMKMSSTITEEGEFAALKEKCEKEGLECPPHESAAVRHFVLDEQIFISVVEKPYGDSEDKSGATLILRSIAGKKVWDFYHVSDVALSKVGDRKKKEAGKAEEQGKAEAVREEREGEEEKVETEEEKEEQAATQRPSRTIIKEEYEDRLALGLKRQAEEDEKCNPSDFTAASRTARVPTLRHDALQRHERTAEAVENAESIIFNREIKPVVPVHPPHEEKLLGHWVNRARTILHHLGLLSIHNFSRFLPLEPGVKLDRNLKNLDKTTERECHKIGVIYVRAGQRDQRDIFKNEGGSEDYQSFLASLGWLVDLSEHRGFLGGLDPKLTTGRFAPYFADHSVEVIFHVPTMMPNNPNDEQQIHKKRHVGNDHVTVVWSEDDYAYRPNTITSQFNHVHIVITPLKNGLYQVAVHTKKSLSIPFFGPLIDGMVVSKKVLGPLVRLTAVNANKSVRYMEEAYKKPLPTRKAIIEDISSRHRLEPKYANLLSSMFSTDPYSEGSRDSGA